MICILLSAAYGCCRIFPNLVAGLFSSCCNKRTTAPGSFVVTCPIASVSKLIRGGLPSLLTNQIVHRYIEGTLGEHDEVVQQYIDSFTKLKSDFINETSIVTETVAHRTLTVAKKISKETS
jgi:hypothetical protein